MPTTYIDAGTAEVFRDEDQQYAGRIWAAGGRAELHMWDGGTHGFDAMNPTAAISHTARSTRTAWLRRVLGAASNADHLAGFGKRLAVSATSARSPSSGRR